MGCWLQGQTCPCGWCFLRQLWVSSRGGSSSLGCGSPVGTGVDALCGICGSALRSESPVGTDVGSLAGAVGLDPAVGCLRQQEQVLGCAGPLGSVVSQPLTQGDGSGVPVSHLLAYLYVGSAAGPGPEASEPRPAMTIVVDLLLRSARGLGVSRRQKGAACILHPAQPALTRHVDTKCPPDF